MNKKKRNFYVESKERKKHAYPYSMREILIWYRRFRNGPTTKNKLNVNLIPQEHVLNEISPKITLAFIGDIMELAGRTVTFGKDIKDFLRGTNYLIGNFEATITTENKIFFDQRHIPQIVNALEHLFPPHRTYLSVANNHSGDFGKQIFLKSIQKLLDRGFTIFGTINKPFIDLENVIRIIAGSMWSNRPCDYLINFYDSSTFIHPNKCNIFYPHWGYELCYFPDKPLMKIGKEYILKYDAILGHHSHIPHPITFFQQNGIKKLLATSLGDFCYGDNPEARDLENYIYGSMLKCELGITSKGKWQIGKVSWRYVKSNRTPDDQFEVNLLNKTTLL